jgi:tRNA (guanine37-N1)-methyltransferase
MTESLSSTSLIEATLASQNKPLIEPPSSSDFVYPASDFPPLSAFEIKTEQPALIIPARMTADLRKRLHDVILNRPKTRFIFSVADSEKIPSDNDDNNRKNFRKLVLEHKPDVYDHPVISDLLKSGECCRGTHTMTIAYEDWTVDEVLRRMLPVKEVPSSFEIIGHLIHVNLREEVLPYKYFVGKVILDKHAPRIKTVVNKIGTIETEYRTFGMEIIAGRSTPGWSEVMLKEEGCEYHLDFQSVYWNSRLAGEHRRLVEEIRADAEERPIDSPLVVADLMAGIGPFAVPLTSKGDNIHVWANDLNPASFKYLKINSKKNRCQNLHCFNMDGRAFCHKLQDDGIDFHHVCMNLPASAPEFLDAFRGFTGKTLPRIHVHCFGPKLISEAEKETIARCSAALNCTLVEKDEVSVHTVRDVSPKKNMYCVSFTLPEAVRSISRIKVVESTRETPASSSSNDDEPDLKKQKKTN